MTELIKKIETIVHKHLTSLNQKIIGTSFLEKLKFLILDEINANPKEYNYNGQDNTSNKIIIKSDYKSITIFLNYLNSQNIQMNREIEVDTLIISLNELLNIDILDKEKKIRKTFKLYQNSGLTIPKRTFLNMSYSKKNLVLEICSIDHQIDIENNENDTILDK